MLSSMMAARYLICASSQIVSRPAGLGLTRHGTLMITATLSDMGRLPSFSRILYKNFMCFRVWGNYGHTPDTWHGHVIGQRTSQYGQKRSFVSVSQYEICIIEPVLSPAYKAIIYT